MYPGGTGTVGAGVDPVKESTLQSLNSFAMEQVNALEQMVNRLESFADRLEPTPKAIPSQAQNPSPPMAVNLNGLRQRLDAFRERVGWLGQVIDRLERIA